MKKLPFIPHVFVALAVVLSVFSAGLPFARTAQAAAIVVLYDGANQTGASLSLDYYQSIPELSLFAFDNLASSISITGGWQVSLYSEVNYGGECVDLRSSLSALTSLGIADNDVSSLRFNQACSGPRASYARLHHHTTAHATGANIYDDTPDLRAVNSNDTTSAITLHGLYAVAVYSDINYTGRCETFIPRNQGDVSGTTIGNDTISSIRLNYTCLGPVRQAPAITHIKVLNNPSDVTDCGSTYTRRTKDLNANAGGNWIYLCIQYGPFQPLRSFLADLTVASQIVPIVPTGCIDSDLNEDAGGSYVYFCPAYGATALPSSQFALRDIDFISYDDILDALGSNHTEDCQWKMGDSANTTVFASNLNSDAGGDYIHTCLLGYSSEQDSFDPYLSLPSMLTAIQNPANPSGTPVNYNVSAYDYQGTSLALTCSPANSGIQGWFTWAQLGATTIDCSTTDGEGRTTAGSFEIQVMPPPDVTPPVVSPSATSGGVLYAPGTWTNQSVTVTFTCTDEEDGSGVENVTDPVDVTTEGANQSVVGTCEDVAGNSSSTTFSGINIDKTAPVIEFESRTPANDAGWINEDVTVTWTCQDTLSGPVAGIVIQTVTAEGASQFSTGTCDDLAGNSASDTQTGISLDKTAPTIALVSRTPANGAGWNKADVVVEWSCSDTLSGPVDSAVSGTVSSDGQSQSSIGTCEDLAGNTTSDTQTGINIDRTAPDADHGGPYTVSEGETIQLDGSNSSDSLSGIADIAWSTDGDEVFEEGNPASFSQPDGPAVYTVKLLVEDLAGNDTVVTTTVTVSNLPPAIQVITTNSPVPQGQPATIDVDATDPGIDDVLSYAFDCDNDGLYETPGNGHRGACNLDPAVAYSNIGVRVSDDDQGVTASSVTVSQTITLCGNSMSGALSATGHDGNCSSGSTGLVLPMPSPVRLCVNGATGVILWARNGSCPGGYRAHLVPASGPFHYCESLWTGKLRGTFLPGQCSAQERAGVIPG